MNNFTKLTLTIMISVTLGGCFNLPSDPAQITGIHVSDQKYSRYDCNELAVEMNSLARRENLLIVAQEQRRSSSKFQAFWTGFGNGDGIEAAELASVRGELEAIRRSTEARCINSEINIVE